MPASIVEIVASIMEVPASDVDDDSSAQTLAKWDSMRELMLGSMLESEYGFTLTSDEIVALKSVKKIREILHAHGIDAR